MALGDFLKKKADDAGPDELREAAEQYARRAQTFAEGRMQASWKMVALITLSEEVRQWLRERLQRLPDARQVVVRVGHDGDFHRSSRRA